jgi:hypothetical protein
MALDCGLRNFIPSTTRVIMEQPDRIPLSLKLAYTAFVAVLVPCYWRYWGPQNFLNFCDIAVLLTLVGIWRESALLISMQALAVIVVQTLWLVDFAGHFAGWHMMGMTDYMFDQRTSPFLRALSLFHGWMPMLLLWLVYRLGYDRRALRIQSVAGVVILLVCYFCFTAPGTIGSRQMAVNLNLVFGLSNTASQKVMPPLLWLGIMLAGLPIAIYWPTHWMLRRMFGGSRKEMPKGATDFCTM